MSSGLSTPLRALKRVIFLVREKTIRRPSVREVSYDQRHWDILREKRAEAIALMKRLRHFEPVVHGSLARGDVHAGSDIDIVLLQEVPSYAVEIALGSHTMRREIVQATPWHLIKGQIYIHEDVSVTFPLVKPSPLEEQFYYFGGCLDLDRLEAGERTSGIDKRLMLIEPTERGHVEYSVIGREASAAKKVGVSLQMVKERVDVLTRRDRVGRTGIYLRRILEPDQSFEDVLRDLASRDPNLKRRVAKL